MPCGGGDLWPLFYLAFIVAALSLYFWLPQRHVVLVALTILGIQFLTFNILHDSCSWFWWSNALADMFILGLVAFRLVTAEPKSLLQIVALIVAARVAWHLIWGMLEVDNLTYAELNNALWGLATIIVIGWGMSEKYRRSRSNL